MRGLIIHSCSPSSPSAESTKWHSAAEAGPSPLGGAHANRAEAEVGVRWRLESRIAALADGRVETGGVELAHAAEARPKRGVDYYSGPIERAPPCAACEFAIVVAKASLRVATAAKADGSGGVLHVHVAVGAAVARLSLRPTTFIEAARRGVLAHDGRRCAAGAVVEADEPGPFDLAEVARRIVVRVRRREEQQEQ